MSQIIRKNLSILNQLKGCSSLDGVADETVREIYRLGTVRQYDKGEPVIQAKEKIAFVCFLLSGKAIQYNLTHLGKRKILFVFGPGALLNDQVFDNHPSSIYCDAIETCRLLAVPREKILELMEKDYCLVRGLMRDEERKLRRLQHQLKNSVGSIYMDRKLAAKLWKLARDFGVPADSGVEIDMNISVTFLADMLGTPRETASRLIRDLTGYGLIRHEKKRIYIFDQDRLARFYKTGEV